MSSPRKSIRGRDDDGGEGEGDMAMGMVDD